MDYNKEENKKMKPKQRNINEVPADEIRSILAELEKRQKENEKRRKKENK